MKAWIIISSMLLLILIGCNGEERKESEKLVEYLQETFDLRIPQERHYFLFIPESGCKGCVAYARQIDGENGYRENVTVIYLVAGIDSTSLPEKPPRRHIGTIASMRNSGLLYLSTAIIETKDGSVGRVHDLDANNIAEVIRTIQR